MRRLHQKKNFRDFFFNCAQSLPALRYIKKIYKKSASLGTLTMLWEKTVFHETTWIRVAAKENSWPIIRKILFVGTLHEKILSFSIYSFLVVYNTWQICICEIMLQIIQVSWDVFFGNKWYTFPKGCFSNIKIFQNDILILTSTGFKKCIFQFSFLFKCF